MECAAGYAVALDEDGRFVRVPNLGYEVGQTVDDVVLFDDDEAPEAAPAPVRRRPRLRLVAALAAAACLCAAVVGGAYVWQTPIGTVRMRINPEMSMEVNRLDRVVGLSGENADGESLIEGMEFYGRTVDEVTDDLASRAEDQGFLADGGTIEIEVDSEDDEWKTATEDRLIIELEVHLDHRVSVTEYGAAPVATEEEEPEEEVEPVEEPVPAPEPTPAPAPAPTAAPVPVVVDDDDGDDDWDDDGDDDWDDWDDDGDDDDDD